MLSNEEWDEAIGDLERQLDWLEDDDPTAGESLYARWGRLHDGLVQLQSYYARIPEETARYSSDQTLLRQVRRVAARRMRLIDDLLKALERV